MVVEGEQDMTETEKEVLNDKGELNRRMERKFGQSQCNERIKSEQDEAQWRKAPGWECGE